MTVLYEDPRIRLDDEGISIRWYHFPFGTKRIRYDAIRSLRRRPLSYLERWRIWGSSDFRHWFNLDMSRPRKQEGIVVDVGRWTRVVLTPDDLDKVQAILESRASPR